MGSVYLRKGSRKLWIKYIQHGRVVRESTQTDNIVVARRMLRVREGEVERGVPIDTKAGRITFEEAVADLLNDYSTNRKKTYAMVKRRIELYIEPAFGGRRMSSITTSDLRAYIAKRQADGTPERKRKAQAALEMPPSGSEPRKPVSPALINRELTVLKRMFSLAIQAGKLHHKPHFPMLREDNVRAGFFEREQYEAVIEHLSPAMRPVVTFAYVTGWRIGSEVLPLQWRQLDLKAGEVRLDPGTTKNREGRVFYLTRELRELLRDATPKRRPHPAPEGPHRPARVLPCPGRHQERQAVVDVRPADHRERFLPRVVPRPRGGRLPRQHPARPPPDGDPEHGARGHPGARGDEVEWPQDPQRVRPLQHRE